MTDSKIIKYDEGYESVPQAEIDALTRDDLLRIATDFGHRRLVRCVLPPSDCAVEHGPSNIVAADEAALGVSAFRSSPGDPPGHDPCGGETSGRPTGA